VNSLIELAEIIRKKSQSERFDAFELWRGRHVKKLGFEFAVSQKELEQCQIDLIAEKKHEVNFKMAKALSSVTPWTEKAEPLLGPNVKKYQTEVVVICD